MLRSAPLKSYNSDYLTPGQQLIMIHRVSRVWSPIRFKINFKSAFIYLSNLPQHKKRLGKTQNEIYSFESSTYVVLTDTNIADHFKLLPLCSSLVGEFKRPSSSPVSCNVREGPSIFLGVDIICFFFVS